jgi:hypothetical protein
MHVSSPAIFVLLGVVAMVAAQGLTFHIKSFANSLNVSGCSLSYWLSYQSSQRLDECAGM